MTGEEVILLAEDEETDVLLLRRAFKDAGVPNPIEVAVDGIAAVDYLSRERQPPNDRLPCLVILDLKMPRRNGFEVLKWMREQPGLSTLPVIIFSSSAHRGEVERAYALGANAFIVKPPSTGDRTEVARFIKQWLRFSQPPLAALEGLAAARAHRVAG